MKLLDRRILVTGGSSGIGKAIAELLVRSGAKVAITGRDKEKLNRVSKENGFLGIPLDISSDSEIENCFNTIDNKWGGLDVLVNNAGIGSFPQTEDVTREELRKVYDVNVFGTAVMTKNAVNIFKFQGKGNLVNIISTSALKGSNGGTIYSGSKFALRGMSLSWFEELRQYNIRVININPGATTTAFFSSDRTVPNPKNNELLPIDIAKVVKNTLEQDDRVLVQETTLFINNPF